MSRHLVCESYLKSVQFKHRMDHGQQDQVEWIKLDPNEEARAKTLEEASKATIEGLFIWRCNKCLNPSGTLLGQSRHYTKPDLIQHLDERWVVLAFYSMYCPPDLFIPQSHAIADAREGEHYHKDFDKSEAYGGIPIILKPVEV